MADLLNKLLADLTLSELLKLQDAVSQKIADRKEVHKLVNQLMLA